MGVFRRFLPQIYQHTEIVLIEESTYKGQYPGLFLITSVSRMMRPVVNLQHGLIEYVGTLEQLYLNIAVSLDDIEDGVKGLCNRVFTLLVILVFLIVGN